MQPGIDNVFPTASTGINCSGFSIQFYVLFLAVAVLFCADNGRAQTSLTWDAGNTDSGFTIVPGSGIWNTTANNLVWNNTNTGVNLAWSQASSTSPTYGAIFGGTDGSYAITIGTQIASTNIFINNSGYTFSGSSGIFIANNGGIDLATDKTATLNCPLASTGLNYFELGSGSTLNLTASNSSTALQARFFGSGTANISDANFTPEFLIANANVNLLSGSTVTIEGVNVLYIGYTVGTYNGVGTGETGALTVNGGILNQNEDKIVIARGGGSGTLTLQSGAINFDTTANIGGNGIIAIPNNDTGANHASFDVYGGILTAGSAAHGVGISPPQGQIQILGGGSVAGEYGGFTQTGGVVYAWGGISFGESGGSVGGTGALTNSGGTLYLGSSGISLAGPGSSNYLVSLSGGTLGALGSWSSPLPMTLSSANGNITFQCADNNGNPNNITLTGTLSGSGGLNVTGRGILTLGVTNTYLGSTAVNAGTLAVTTASTGGGTYSLAANTSMNLQMVSAGSSLNMSSLTIGGVNTLNFSPGTFGNPTAPIINVSGALTPNSTVTINLATGTLTNGQFTLIKYGSLGGAGFGAFMLGNLAGEATLINDTTNNSIDISIGSALTWDGTVNGNWDIGGTANWKTNAYYMQNDGTGPIVIFDDTASGGNTNITLNTTVSPAGVLVNNSAEVYSIKGMGTISGTGSLAKEGSNTLILATDNNYSGQLSSYNTVISGGTLQLGDGLTNNGSVTGTINDQATLAVDNPTAQTLTNTINGPGVLTKSGSGTLTLTANNTYTGGTTINAGTLVVSPVNNVSMPYTNNAGTLQVNAITGGSSVAMSGLVFGTTNSQLTVNTGGDVPGVPAINDKGNLTMVGNITVNAAYVAPTGTNVALQYASRSGPGSFVAGSLPAGVTLVDNRSAGQVQLIHTVQPTVMIPTFNTNEAIVSVVTPQEFGAKGDGITDDSAAFQNAMNVVSNLGGGVIFVPAATYAFYTNLIIPTGVTLHGDWTDWTTGTNGLAGTTFKVYFGAGQTNATPFITMNSSSTLRGINFWYPDQNPESIIGYPFTISANASCVLKNIVLVNSYEGIEVDGPLFIFSTVIGTPLYMGMTTSGTIADVCHSEDIRFSPDVWPSSGLTNAPAGGGSYAAWMRTYGTGMQLFRLDGLLSMYTCISGYKVGIDAESNPNGSAGATFYGGSVSNCAIAYNAQQMPGQSGFQFANFTLDGGIAVNRTTSTDDATVSFDHCQIIGRNGIAVYSTGSDWHSWMAFQNCTISNTMQLAGPGVFNVVDSTLEGNTQCVMSASATRAAFTGCTFSSTTNIINLGNANNLLMDARQSFSNAFPIVYWTNVLNDYQSRQPARTNLYVATDPIWGATGNGTSDDTAAIQSALTAAGGNGGGIVYLPGGQYHLTNTLDVPGGVELRGAREMRGAPLSVLEPYEGQGTTNGPVALALEANSGIVGVTFNYVAQNTNNYPYPATIQGRGANIYAIGVGEGNMVTYHYVDLDTYPCLNHLMYMVDGWTLSQGITVGNGSSGSIVDGHGNGGSSGTVWDFAGSNSQMYVFGDCAETMVEDFSINQNTFVDCVSENGGGPNLTAIGAYCDGTTRGFVLDAAAPCEINVVNATMAIFALVDTFSNATVGVISATNFQGTARFFNTALFGGPLWDFVVNGGDVGLDEVHMLDVGLESQVNGGVFHLINNGGYITYHNGSNDFPPYRISFGTNAGIAGKVSEVIGDYAYNGYSYTNYNTNNLNNIWLDYALNGYAVLSLTNQLQDYQAGSLQLSIDYDASTQGHGLAIQWPGDIGSLYLYYTPNLAPPVVWIPVTNNPVYSNNQWIVTMPVGTNQSGFYRLQQ